MYKFFVTNNQINQDIAQVIGEDVNHIKNVLRLQKEDEIQICNGDTKTSYIAKILELDKNKIFVKLIKELKESTESKISIHIFQGLPKQDKMEQIIQKATEIGVSDITPLKMERCVVKLEDNSIKKKIDRWQKIAEVAAKQSKRDKIPNIHSYICLKNIYEKIEKYDIVIVAYEEETDITIKQILKTLDKTQIQNIAIIIGPEGRNSKRGS